MAYAGNGAVITRILLNVFVEIEITHIAEIIITSKERQAFALSRPVNPSMHSHPNGRMGFILMLRLGM
jgi:hypothetical protein